jgi:hypothetical protein
LGLVTPEQASVLSIPAQEFVAALHRCVKHFSTAVLGPARPPVLPSVVADQIQDWFFGQQFARVRAAVAPPDGRASCPA